MTNLSSETNDFIHILQWNCRSIIPKLDSFKAMINNLKCDVFSICETWLTPDINLNFNNYNIVRLDRDIPYGGVLLGIKKCYSFYKINLPSIQGIECVACQINIQDKDLCIASVYIPPKALIRQQMLSDIVELLPSPRLILGDFNSHGVAWGSSYNDNRSTLIYNLCDNFNMTVLNNGDMTRVPKPPARPSALDLSLCSTSLRLDCSWKVVYDPHGSDHLPILISINNGSNSTRPIDIPYDLTLNIDWEIYKLKITEALEALQHLPLLEKYDSFAGLILNSAILAQRKKYLGVSTKRRLSTPWWDKECSKIYVKKSNAYEIFRKKGKIEDFVRYMKLESMFKNLIKAKKRGYWRRFVNELSRETSMNTLWNTARRMRNRVVANENEEYSNQWILNFAKKVCPDTVPAQKINRDNFSEQSVMELPFSITELSIALLSSNNNAPGLDKIKFYLLKNLPDIAKKMLLDLYNNFFELNIIPHDWRQVKVIAIQKPGKPASNHNSYRPIAMLSCIRKLFEKMILYRLDHWVESNNLLSHTQFGFRRTKGTNDCLALLSTEIQIAFAQKNKWLLYS